SAGSVNSPPFNAISRSRRVVKSPSKEADAASSSDAVMGEFLPLLLIVGSAGMLVCSFMAEMVFDSKCKLRFVFRARRDSDMAGPLCCRRGAPMLGIPQRRTLRGKGDRQDQ